MSIISALSTVTSLIGGSTTTTLSTIKDDGHINKPVALGTLGSSISMSATVTSGGIMNEIDLYNNGLRGAAEQKYEQRVEYTDELTAYFDSLSEEQQQELLIKAKLLKDNNEETEKNSVKTI